MRDRVKWFNNENDYGFILYKDVEDTFINYSAIRQESYKKLEEGKLVEFELVETNKGYQAIDVSIPKEFTTIK